MSLSTLRSATKVSIIVAMDAYYEWHKSATNNVFYVF